MEMENKNNGGLIAIIIILIVALLGLSFYVAYDKGLIFNDGEKEVEENEKDVEVEEDTNVKENESNYVSLEIKDENCINSNTSTYKVRYGFDNMSISINDDNTVTLSISQLSMWGGLTNYSDYETFTINNLGKKVIDVHAGGLSQDIGTITIIFLMEDGTLEYIPLYKALQLHNVQSYGSVANVDGIIKLYSAGAFPKDSPLGGSFTILAQKADGTYYDLRPILMATGNY